jgi:hypothetical protein
VLIAVEPPPDGKGFAKSRLRVRKIAPINSEAEIVQSGSQFRASRGIFMVKNVYGDVVFSGSLVVKAKVMINPADYAS